MSTPHFYRESSSRPFPWVKKLQPIAERIIADHNCAGDVNFVLCSDATIKSINTEFRQQAKVTDVISMEWHTPELLGEVYIAEAQVKRQAERYQVSYYQELLRMIIHGTLHLAGFDHLQPQDRKIMRAQEQFYHELAQGKKPWASP